MRLDESKLTQQEASQWFPLFQSVVLSHFPCQANHKVILGLP
jgi:hypothetical protein